MDNAQREFEFQLATYGVSLNLLLQGNKVFVNRNENKVNNTNPLNNIVYTDKVKKQMQLDDYHSFPVSVDSFGSDGKITKIVGGDKVTRTKVEISGAYKGREGVFQYIIESDGVTCNHRLFVPNK